MSETSSGWLSCPMHADISCLTQAQCRQQNMVCSTVSPLSTPCTQEGQSALSFCGDNFENTRDLGVPASCGSLHLPACTRTSISADLESCSIVHVALGVPIHTVCHWLVVFSRSCSLMQIALSKNSGQAALNSFSIFRFSNRITNKYAGDILVNTKAAISKTERKPPATRIAASLGLGDR